MKLCYVDESGTGDEPVATMVGIVVDAQRMHVTKEHWDGLLDALSNIAGRKLLELHTRDFYSGNGVWHKTMDGAERAEVITTVFEWLNERKHSVVYSAVVKSPFYHALKSKKIPIGLNTPWRFMAFHLILSLQKRFQRESKNKGHTIVVFDNEERERARINDLINNPPSWSESYYKKKKRQDPLDQIVDVPYFGDSTEVPLIQVADFVTYFLRRYCELIDGHMPSKYDDEIERVKKWAAMISSLSIGRSCMYSARGRCDIEEMFFNHAPKAIRNI